MVELFSCPGDTPQIQILNYDWCANYIKTWPKIKSLIGVVMTASTRKILLLIVIVSLPCLLIASLSIGDSEVGLQQVLNYFLGEKISSIDRLVIQDIRMPRAFAAALTGAALGVSGAMLQGMLRNPLASPFLLGISSGAGVCVVILFALNVAAVWVPIGAWFGAVVASSLVFLISYQRQRISLERLILAGVAVSSVLGSIQAIVLLRSDDTRIQNSLTWLSGTLAAITWDDLAFTWIPIVVCLLTSLIFAKQLNLALLDDDTSQSLGLSIVKLRLMVGLIATILTACAVCISGLVGFVGLVIPHMVRLVCGSNFMYVLPTSGLMGGVVLLGADTLARSYLWELPVGLVTSLLGSPFFIYLLQRRHIHQSM